MGLQHLICYIPHVSSIFLGLLLSFPLSALAQQEMTQPLQGLIGQADRGRALVSNKQKSLCLLCHQGPIPEDRFQGNLAPELSLIAQRLNAAQLRARIVDASQFNSQTIMPSYYRTEGLNRVLQSFKGQTILTAQEIEDVIAFLETLKP
jgi:L-cysteine S-thiosulfotransferase